MSDLFRMDSFQAKEMERFKGPPIVENRIVREVRKLRDSVAEARRQLIHSNMTPTERLTMTEAVQTAARETVAGLVADEIARLDADLARERTKIERDREINRAKYDREIATAERKYAAMSPDELRAEAMRIASNPGPMLPEILDIVSANLKALPPVPQGGLRDIVDPRDHAGFRKTIAEARLYEAERWTESGQRTAKTRDVLANTSDGAFVPLVHEDGSISAIRTSDAVGGLV